MTRRATAFVCWSRMYVVVFERYDRISQTPTQTHLNKQQHTTTIECGEGYVGVPGKIDALRGNRRWCCECDHNNRNCVERICESYELPEGYRDSANETISG